MKLCHAWPAKPAVRRQPRCKRAPDWVNYAVYDYGQWRRRGLGMKSVKGTRDLLPRDTYLFQQLEQGALVHFARYGFREIRTPIFEETQLFLRGIGDETDIVSKEMYSFEDKGGRSITLRPELTAAVCRAVIQHQLVGPTDIVKLMYMGPMFRYERPQAGRYRQFYQLGVEVFGSDDPLIDVETIEALMSFIQPYGLPNLELIVNSVGDSTDRPAYLAYLREALDDVRDQLCNDCQTRMVRNVLRVLDCKNENCQSLFGELRPISDFLSHENRQHFEAVCNGLSQLGIPYRLNPKLVRGLDYYTKTAFELVSGDLGAQSAVMGGGRYDNLVQTLGGAATPAFGWAMGLDRMASLLAARGMEEKGPDLFLVFGERSWLDQALPWIVKLRHQGLEVTYDLRVGSFKSQMKRANRENARWTGIIGTAEWANGTVSMKHMATSEQTTLARENVAKFIEEQHA